MTPAPLPNAVQTALSAIARDLRHIPRESCASIPDILLYVRRQAKRVDGVREMRVVAPKPASRPPPLCATTPRDSAEAVFGGASKTSARVQRRSILSRRGRRVMVETRQIEMVW